MTASTDGITDKDYNECGIHTQHAYTIITTFVMYDELFKQYNMTMIRNPRAFSTYTGKWSVIDI